MLYTDLLKTQTTCPFCEPITNEIIEKNSSSFLTFSIAPYHRHHLMVIPFRHVDDFKDLSEEETVELQKLLHRGVLLIEALGYRDYTILVRNGVNTGKSVAHLHYHIVPSVIIGDLDHKGKERTVMTKEEIAQLMRELREVSGK
ncbi:HIT domain-containing protein [bacterium]|nr:HIT domain-containing protein [bacterium]